MSDPTNNVRLGVDAVAASTIGASIMSWLPAGIGLVGSTLGVLWFTIQIWESKTVTEMLARWTERRRVKRVRYYQAKQKIIVAKLSAAEHVRVSKVKAVELVETAKAEAAIVKAVEAVIPIEHTDGEASR